MSQFPTTNVAPPERKAWTRQHYRGVENLLLPSYGPDLETIDEAGIRRDVRQALAHGFFATMLAELGHEVTTTAKILRIACDEAQGRLLVGAIAEYHTLAENLELVRQAEAAGCSHVLVGYPPNLQPASEEEVYDYFRQLIEASQLGIMLYATAGENLKQFDPTGVPLAVFDRLVDLPTVAGMKLTETIDPLLAYQCCARYADKLAINCVPLELMPILGREFAVHWSGEWIAEAVQSPDQRYVVDYVALLNEGKFDEAIQLYWQFNPLYQQMADLQKPLLLKGGHPWQTIKFFQWATGGNGGLISIKGQTTDQVGMLTPELRRQIIATYKQVGITPVEQPEEAFITGAENYQKGISASAYTKRPCYR